MNQLVAPFPYFGGKRTVAAEVWTRFGDVRNYVEPFFGSGAVLLARPHEAKTETVNDVDHFICNFWRSVQADSDSVARYADWPVNEADLMSRHYWLVTEGRERIALCGGDPSHYDTQVAGWWCWGACAWIGSGWCSGDGPWTWADDDWRQLPHLSAGRGINRKLPHLSAGRGINRKLPHLSAGQGINRQLPHLSAGRGEAIGQWMRALSDRLREVRVCCGDWSRVCGDTVTWRHGVTGVFLDPPYGVDDRAAVYSHDSLDVSRQVREWAIEAGKRPDMRIAFAGYDGEHEFPGWSAHRWKASGGYGSQGESQGRANCKREVIWFSPACLAPEQPSLFDASRLNEAYDRATTDIFARVTA